MSSSHPSDDQPAELVAIDPSSIYICGVFEFTVVIGRVSGTNRKRAGQLMETLKGPGNEELEQWQDGTRAELLATFPDVLGDWSFDRADDAYRLNPQHQISFERPDI